MIHVDFSVVRSYNYVLTGDRWSRGFQVGSEKKCRSITFASAAPHCYGFLCSVTNDRPIAAFLAGGDRSGAAGKGTSHGVQS